MRLYCGPKRHKQKMKKEGAALTAAIVRISRRIRQKKNKNIVKLNKIINKKLNARKS